MLKFLKSQEVETGQKTGLARPTQTREVQRASPSPAVSSPKDRARQYHEALPQVHGGRDSLFEIDTQTILSNLPTKAAAK